MLTVWPAPRRPVMHVIGLAPAQRVRVGAGAARRAPHGPRKGNKMPPLASARGSVGQMGDVTMGDDASPRLESRSPPRRESRSPREARPWVVRDIDSSSDESRARREKKDAGGTPRRSRDAHTRASDEVELLYDGDAHEEEGDAYEEGDAHEEEDNAPEEAEEGDAQEEADRTPDEVECQLLRAAVRSFQDAGGDIKRLIPQAPKAPPPPHKDDSWGERDGRRTMLGGGGGTKGGNKGKGGGGMKGGTGMGGAWRNEVASKLENMIGDAHSGGGGFDKLETMMGGAWRKDEHIDDWSDAQGNKYVTRDGDSWYGGSWYDTKGNGKHDDGQYNGKGKRKHADSWYNEEDNDEHGGDWYDSKGNDKHIDGWYDAKGSKYNTRERDIEGDSDEDDHDWWYDVKVSGKYHDDWYESKRNRSWYDEKDKWGKHDDGWYDTRGGDDGYDAKLAKGNGKIETDDGYDAKRAKGNETHGDETRDGEPPRRRERGGRHIKMAQELAAAFRNGSIDERALDEDMRRYVEWSRRMHARLWRGV